MAGLETPAVTTGSSLLPQVNDPLAVGNRDIDYKGYTKTIRTENYRLILHKNGTTELYDHRNTDGETTNLSTNQPDIVKQLSTQLKARVK